MRAKEACGGEFIDARKMLLSALAGFIIMFTLSAIWYLGIAEEYYYREFAEVNRPEYKIPWIALGYAVWAVLMAYLYPIGYKGGEPVKEGARFGALIGLISVLPVMLVLYGAYTVPLTASLVDAAYHVVEKSIGGTAIGYIYGKG